MINKQNRCLSLLKNNQGVTLLELLTAMLITIIIGTVAISFLSVTMKRYQLQDNVNKQTTLIESICSTLDNELRYSEDISIDSYHVGEYPSSYYSIVFQENQLFLNGEVFLKESMKEYSTELIFSKLDDNCIGIDISIGNDIVTSKRHYIIRTLNDIDIQGSSESCIYYQ